VLHLQQTLNTLPLWLGVFCMPKIKEGGYELIFSYNRYKSLKQNMIFLANPQKNKIGLLGHVENLHFKLNLINISEISFLIYEKVNGEINQFYDKVVGKRLIEIQNLGWFQIVKADETDDGLSAYKEVQCKSLEFELVGKRIYDINGVFALYEPNDTSKSLLHIIAKETNWKIGHVDNSLQSKWRTFSIDSSQIYNILTTDVSKSFNCIFSFNTFDRTINAYDMSNIGRLTDIVLSRKNILKEYIRESDTDKIVTKLKVLGDDSVDIRAVNPTGTNYLINIDYFLTTDWMSQSLINSWNLWKSKYTANLSGHEIVLAQLQTYLAELTVLNEQLKTLQNELKTQNGVRDSLVSVHDGTPVPTDPDYVLYQETLNIITSIESQISAKKIEITSKEGRVASTQTSLDSIGTDLSMESNFTPEQLIELNNFLTENDEYQDSTFVATKTMTKEAILAMKRELMANGDSELQRASQPQYTVTITANNLFTMQDGADSRIPNEKWFENFELGNLITIKFRNNYNSTARLISIEFDFNDLENIELTFSDKNRLEDAYVQFAELAALAGHTATSLSLHKFGYDEAADITSDVTEFINGNLNAANNEIVNSDNQDLLINKYGARFRKWLPEQNKFDDHQSWWNNNLLLFSDDGFKTSKTGIGLFTDEDGNSTYSIIADAIVGNFILSKKLKVVNETNSILMDNDGITITGSANTVKLNSIDGIQILKGASKQLYLDTNGNAVFNGIVTCIEGRIGSFNISATGLFSDNMQFYDEDGSPFMWMSRYGTDRTKWIERANYEPSVVVLRKIEGDIETDATLRARNGLSLTLDRYYASTGIIIDSIEITTNRIEFNKNGQFSSIDFSDYNNGTLNFQANHVTVNGMEIR
jgi:hypothetical protein